MPTYSKDWVSARTADWARWLAPFRGKSGISALEIGTFEGRSAVWFLENILTDATSRLTCIDIEKNEIAVKNLSAFSQKAFYKITPSHIALRSEAPDSALYNFVYIDGSHRAADVLEDAVLAFRLLKPAGVMIFDDYLWRRELPAVERPQIAIDSFLSVYSGQIKLLGKHYQVAIEKLGQQT